MHPAALPPIQPTITAQDRAHPLFPLYAQYRASMNRLLVEAASFENWKYCHERRLREESFTKHPRFREFQAWMRDHQGGARPCPTGSFPSNFCFWLNGGRW